MQIIPSINCDNFDCVANRLKKTKEFSEWAHIDVTDGKFSPAHMWNNPEELQTLVETAGKLLPHFEVHLMVDKPIEIIDAWIKSGAKRLIVHLETLSSNEEFNTISEKCRAKGVEIMLAVRPETPAEKVTPFLEEIHFVQTLAEPPGRGGQKFQPETLEKIKFFKKHYPQVIVEVDGGVVLDIARQIKEAGADLAVSGTYIWESENPKAAYEQLEAL